MRHIRIYQPCCDSGLVAIGPYPLNMRYSSTSVFQSRLKGGSVNLPWFMGKRLIALAMFVWGPSVEIDLSLSNK